MNKTILIQDGEMLQRAFCKGAAGRAEPGDTLVLTSIIALDRDLTLDVPVTIAFDGAESGIDCNGYTIRVQMKEHEGADKGVVNLVQLKRQAITR